MSIYPPTDVAASQALFRLKKLPPPRSVTGIVSPQGPLGGDIMFSSQNGRWLDWRFDHGFTWSYLELNS